MSNPLISEVVAGIHAGAVEAIRKARQFGTSLVISRDGKIAEITPDEAEAMLVEEKKDQ
jgi:hypothetical protein